METLCQEKEYDSTQLCFILFPSDLRNKVQYNCCAFLLALFLASVAQSSSSLSVFALFSTLLFYDIASSYVLIPLLVLLLALVLSLTILSGVLLVSILARNVALQNAFEMDWDYIMWDYIHTYVSEFLLQNAQLLKECQLQKGSIINGLRCRGHNHHHYITIIVINPGGRLLTLITCCACPTVQWWSSVTETQRRGDHCCW